MKLRSAIISASLLALSLFAARPANADGLIVIHNPPRPIPGHFTFAPLEVTYHKVECAITDQVAVTSVDQEFANTNNARLEGEYIFPVPKDTQIDKFSMDIDGKMIEAEFLPADKARKIYEDIVRASKDPALLEYAGRAMYKVRIFPIEPHSKKRVQLKFTQLLKQDNGLLDYHYTLNTEKFSSKPLKNVSMKVTVNSTEPITALYSPTHEVEVIRAKDDDKKATVGFEAKDIRPDTDFHLFIGRKTTPVGINLLTYRPDPAKDGYFVLMAAPTVNKNAKPMPKDVVFVMDTSGSMSGAKIDQARKALKYCIDTLNPEDAFEIVLRFSTEAEPVFGSLVKADEANRKKGVEFALGIKAAGGTAIDEAIEEALDRLTKEMSDGRAVQDRVRMIVFMTDGLPTVGELNPETILAKAKKASQGKTIRIFSFGVGTEVNTKLLDMMAEQTRGYSQYVLEKENLEVSMSNFWGKVQDPILANLKLDTGGIAVTKMYPKEMPDLFRGDQLVVFGTYTKAGNGAIVVTGTAEGKEQKFAQDVKFEEQTDKSREWIAKLWATRRIAFLLDEIRRHGESKELKDEVVELARQWGIVTPYTAMLIIEDEKNRNVPVARRSLREMEHDRGATKFAGEATGGMRKGDQTGMRAVGGSMASNEAKQAQSLERAQSSYEQKDLRMRVGNDEGKADLDNGRSVAALPTAPASPADYKGNVGGENGKELNLGTSSVSGWQNAATFASGGGSGGGYRVVTNYAQQTRVVNNRAFYLNGNQWTDSTVQKKQEAKPTKIVFNSDAYFALLKEHPEAAQYLSLGTNVTLELGGMVYDIVDEPTEAPAAK